MQGKRIGFNYWLWLNFFNAQTSLSIGKSPFEIVSGRQSLLPHIIDHPYTGKNPQAHNFTKEWKQTYRYYSSLLKESLEAYEEVG